MNIDPHCCEKFLDQAFQAFPKIRSTVQLWKYTIPESRFIQSHWTQSCLMVGPPQLWNILFSRTFLISQFQIKQIWKHLTTTHYSSVAHTRDYETYWIFCCSRIHALRCPSLSGKKWRYRRNVALPKTQYQCLLPLTTTFHSSSSNNSRNLSTKAPIFSSANNKSFTWRANHSLSFW